MNAENLGRCLGQVGWLYSKASFDFETPEVRTKALAITGSEPQDRHRDL
jgi:hypothetical protein